MLTNMVKRYVSFMNALRDLPPLIFRATLAYGFYEPAINKLNNFNDVVTWFAEGLKLPLPYLNAVMAVTTEFAGIVLLTLGLATRFISIPLIVVMIVAIKTVHFDNGFTCAKNGIEIPLYFMFMLISLCVTGAGKFSLDELIRRKWQK